MSTKQSTKKIVKVVETFYPVGDVITVTRISQTWNTLYLVQTTQGKFILKEQFRASTASFLKEAKILRIYRNLPTPKLIRSTKNRFVITYGGKHYFMTAFVNGTSFEFGEKLPITILRQMAIALKKIHTKKLSLPKKNIATYVAAFYRRCSPGAVKKMALFALQHLKLRGFFAIPFPCAPIHTDLHSLNIIVNKNKIQAVLDFEDMCFGPRIYDLATTIKDTCWNKATLNTMRTRALLASYGPLTSIEKKHIFDALIIAELYELHWHVISQGAQKIPTSMVRLASERIHCCIRASSVAAA